MRLWRTTELSDGEVDVAKSDMETVPQTWSSDSEAELMQMHCTVVHKQQTTNSFNV